MAPKRFALATAMLTLALPALARAQTPDLAAEGWSMFGVSKVTGNLWRYDFGESKLKHIGKVHNLAGQTLTGIDASCYFLYFQQLHAFWTDPADSQTKMLRVDTQTGLAALDVINLGTGRITGAVSHAVQGPAPDEGMPQTWTYHVYALQDSPGDGDGVSGGLNINPNNSPDNEFITTTAAGANITRDDLHKDSPITGDGVYYEGGATYVRVKPKGNGNQNSLIVNGVVFPVQNGSLYEITNAVNMTVRIQNDKPKNGKAMGHWWIDITADSATITTNGGNPVVGQPSPVSDLIRIDTQTRDFVSVKKLTRKYDSLASSDMSTFYAMSGQGLYKINPANGQEVLLRTHGSDKNLALEFAGSHLLGFEMVDQRMLPYDAISGQVIGNAMNLGMFNLGSMTFVPTELLPDEDYAQFD